MQWKETFQVSHDVREAVSPPLRKIVAEKSDLCGIDENTIALYVEETHFHHVFVCVSSDALLILSSLCTLLFFCSGLMATDWRISITN